MTHGLVLDRAEDPPEIMRISFQHLVFNRPYSHCPTSGNSPGFVLMYTHACTDMGDLFRYTSGGFSPNNPPTLDARAKTGSAFVGGGSVVLSSILSPEKGLHDDKNTNPAAFNYRCIRHRLVNPGVAGLIVLLDQSSCLRTMMRTPDCVYRSALDLPLSAGSY